MKSKNSIINSAFTSSKTSTTSTQSQSQSQSQPQSQSDLPFPQKLPFINEVIRQWPSWSNTRNDKDTSSQTTATTTTMTITETIFKPGELDSSDFRISHEVKIPEVYPYGRSPYMRYYQYYVDGDSTYFIYNSERIWGNSMNYYRPIGKFPELSQLQKRNVHLIIAVPTQTALKQIQAFARNPFS